MTTEELVRRGLTTFLYKGEYGVFKALEKRQKGSKEWIKKELYHLEGNRFEFKDLGYVCKFITKDVKEVDNKSLAECLSCYIKTEHLINEGVLVFKCPDELKDATDIQAFKLPSKKYARFSLNKKGKLLLPQVQEVYNDIPQFWSAYMEMAMYVARNKRYMELQTAYNKIMEQAKELDTGFKIEEGSLSIISMKPNYDGKGLLFHLGQSEFLKYVSVNMEKVKELKKLGFLPKDIEKPYVQIKDIQVDLHIQSLESETKMYRALDHRLELLELRKLH
ncbi:hypothetical protein ABD91_01940 [Lysinibacillus sphaericus]|uniref:hypothetical protein n=1 Tax=Lysinibacillus sphaericus TaxID=1421 RepID=UPI0018CFC80C|nr:hypothetical protein [Lysinibacillus sphaericus]MBG9689684.1 hypothetical protein [Lysinibacillus sphaericus]